jgi:hypothetical protein
VLIAIFEVFEIKCFFEIFERFEVKMVVSRFFIKNISLLGIWLFFACFFCV